MKPGSRPWCRLWGDWIDDHRIQFLSEVDQRRHVALMCLHTRGIAPCGDELVAFKLRVSIDEWKRTKGVFLAAGIIDEGNGLLAWSRRQFESDSSAERVKTFRERHRNDRETLQKRPSNGDVTHSENREQRTEGDKNNMSTGVDSPALHKAKELVKGWNFTAESCGLPKCHGTSHQLAQLEKRLRKDKNFYEEAASAFKVLYDRGASPWVKERGLSMFNAIRPDNLAKIIDGGWSPVEDPNDVPPADYDPEAFRHEKPSV